MDPMQLQLIEIRDQRQTEWFWTDNDIVDEYGEHMGAAAIAVYAVLCRHSNNNTQRAFPSLETIAKKAGLKSRNTAAKAVKVLERFGIVEIKQEHDHRNGKRLNNVYTLSSRKFWHMPGQVAKREAEKKIEVKPMTQETLPKVEVSAFELPAWINKEAWAEWEVFRKEIKKKLTDSTVKKQITFLAQHQADHVAIITQSIQNGWTGLFPLKKQSQARVPSNAMPAKEGKYAHLSK